MGKKLFKLMGVVTAISLLFTNLGNAHLRVSGKEYTAHAIEAGESFEGNPLKGMVPFDYSTTDFPHSLEWFYLPVSAVQLGMNEFDWTVLEKRLDAIAARGHQAVMRFYYDYPGEEIGVPQFLIDQGLEMRYYNEPDNLGGSGYCPDYENLALRQSMKNFIQAFGEQYDGDARIGYITLGLLGFWGEWHNWPFDEDLSDGKPDWSISTDVYREVLDAFDAAFEKTQLCVREPKSNIDYSNYDIGFHDDSFGYSTLSKSNGGQEWFFMQKLIDFNQQDRWKTNCIGGEIYPPSQLGIFSGTSGDYENWDTCLNETHATWMLCENIKYYTGTTLANARAAAKQLGYDFQVSTAYYDDTDVSAPLYLKVDIKNIGTAPFYYDHTMWPVEIGVKQGDTIIKTWQTEWDLCDIPADNTLCSFDYTVDNHNLGAGTYSLCIKVINPVKNGNILGFANKAQGSDGWLNLGTINITNSEAESGEIPTEKSTEVSTETLTETPTETPTETENQSGVSGWETDNFIYIDIRSTKAYENWQLYLDADNNSNTGYLDSSETQAGFDYMIENGILYYHSGNDNTWSWSAVENAVIDVSSTADGMELSIAKSSFDMPISVPKIQVKLLDGAWSAIEILPIVTIKEQETTPVVITDNLEINGCQISATVGGIRTVYSMDSKVEGQDVTEIGLIYGIDGADYRSDDMVTDSNSNSVYVSKGTEENGKIPEVFSKNESYAMTMKFASGTAEEYNMTYYVRAYAKLMDGTYVYTDIKQYSIYEIADYLYQNRAMNNYYSHNYLYENILRVVNADYAMKDYDWNKILLHGTLS